MGVQDFNRLGFLTPPPPMAEVCGAQSEQRGVVASPGHDIRHMLVPKRKFGLVVIHSARRNFVGFSTSSSASRRKHRHVSHQMLGAVCTKAIAPGACSGYLARYFPEQRTTRTFVAGAQQGFEGVTPINHPL